MPDLPPSPDPNTGTRVGPDRRSGPPIPRWVQVSVVIVIGLVGLFVILHLAGGGFGHHSPMLQHWVLRS